MGYWEKVLTTIVSLRWEQVVALLVLLLPIAAVIWMLMKWAYETRIRTLKESLEELRASFDRKAQSAEEKAQADVQWTLTKTKSQLTELETSDRERRIKLAKFYSDLGPNRSGDALEALLDHVRDTYWKPEREGQRRAEAIRKGIPIIHSGAKPPTDEV